MMKGNNRIEQNLVFVMMDEKEKNHDRGTRIFNVKKFEGFETYIRILMRITFIN
jgi:hypothetical protein